MVEEPKPQSKVVKKKKKSKKAGQPKQTISLKLPLDQIILVKQPPIFAKIIAESQYKPVIKETPLSAS